jgi:hypothetical protein
LLVSKVFDALVSLEMILHIVYITLFINPLVGMGTVSIHMSETIRSTAIREENSNLVKSLWAITPEIPSHVWIFAVILWISLLTVDEVWELDWILDKENRGVISDHIVITLFSVKLNCKSSWISISISSTFLSSDS